MECTITETGRSQCRSRNGRDALPGKHECAHGDHAERKEVQRMQPKHKEHDRAPTLETILIGLRLLESRSVGEHEGEHTRKAKQPGQKSIPQHLVRWENLFLATQSSAAISPHDVPQVDRVLVDEAQDVRGVYVRLLRVPGLTRDGIRPPTFISRK